MAESVNQPVNVIRRLYAAKSDSKDADTGVQQHFQELLASGVKVPILTSKTMDLLPNNSLVRFKGMVQDMLNPEFYVAEYRRPGGDWQTSKYCDQVDEPINSYDTETRIAERKPVVIIPIPNETHWVKAAYDAEASTTISTNNTTATIGTTTTRTNGTAKRTRDDEEMTPVEDSTDMGIDTTDNIITTEQNGATAKKPTTATTENEKTSTEQQQTAATGNGVINGKEAGQLPDGSCIVYIYDDSTELKLNDVVEIIGVVSRVPELAMMEESFDDAKESMMDVSLLDEELLASHVPTSKALRIHAVLADTQNNNNNPYHPIIKNNGGENINMNDVNEGRARALGFLSMVLGGDDLAAQYLLLQLVSRVHTRTNVLSSSGGRSNGSATAQPQIPGSSVVGTLPLNLTKCPTAEKDSEQEVETGLSKLGGAVAAALHALCPRVLSSGLSVTALNKQPWWPRRNQNTLRMMSGPLQLAASTQVLLDETVMTAGQLQETGLRNLSAIQDLMRRQQVAYDFEYFGLDQPSDAPVTVLSVGKTLLKGVGEVEVPLIPTAPTGDGYHGVSTVVDSADLAPARKYLATVREMEFTIPDDVAKSLETELAAARAKDSSLSQEAFHRWLNVARLLCVSYGEKELSMERWGQAMELERVREERLK